MKATRALKFVCGLIVVCLAAYGAFKLVAERIIPAHERKAGEMTGAFLAGLAHSAGEDFKKTLKQTPNAQLEADGELFGERFYPMMKGLIRGHLKAMQEDPEKEKISKAMYEAGKEFSKIVAQPFAKGVADGSADALADVGKTLKSIQQFTEQNPELVDAIVQGLGLIHRGLKEIVPPPPPFPKAPGRLLPVPPLPPRSRPPAESDRSE